MDFANCWVFLYVTHWGLTCRFHTFVTTGKAKLGPKKLRKLSAWDCLNQISQFFGQLQMFPFLSAFFSLKSECVWIFSGVSKEILVLRWW